MVRATGGLPWVWLVDQVFVDWFVVGLELGGYYFDGEAVASVVDEIQSAEFGGCWTGWDNLV